MPRFKAITHLKSALGFWVIMGSPGGPKGHRHVLESRPHFDEIRGGRGRRGKRWNFGRSSEGAVRQRFTNRRHATTQRDSHQLQQRVPMSVVEAARSRVAKLKHVLAPGSILEGRVPSTRTTRVRAHPIDQEFCRTEIKASGTGQASNRESTRGSNFFHGLPLLAEGERRLAKLTSVSIPSHSRLQSQRGVGSN